tara:strand:+ start:461 stop:868 length:408 start_codon:yes stop_codon:yes gene_type:complete
MSTLKVNTIQNTSAAHSSTPQQIEQGRAKIWVSFDGYDTSSTLDDWNCTSVTDNDTGDYTLNFGITMANTHYSVAGMSENWEGSPKTDSYTVISEYYQVRTTTTFRFICLRLRYDMQSPQFKDSKHIGLVVFGDV